MRRRKGSQDEKGSGSDSRSPQRSSSRSKRSGSSARREKKKVAESSRRSPSVTGGLIDFASLTGPAELSDKC